MRRLIAAMVGSIKIGAFSQVEKCYAIVLGNGSLNPQLLHSTFPICFTRFFEVCQGKNGKISELYCCTAHFCPFGNFEVRIGCCSSASIFLPVPVGGTSAGST